MTARMLTISLLTLFLFGCAGAMLPGKMYSLKDGVEMNFEIQTSYGTGSMTAYNPSTGESFTGQYTGTYKGGGYAHGTISGPMKTSTVTMYSPPTEANARGVLKGDKGTVISIYLDIRPGLRPTGHGEGIDNNNVRYQIHF